MTWLLVRGTPAQSRALRKLGIAERSTDKTETVTAYCRRRLIQRSEADASASTLDGLTAAIRTAQNSNRERRERRERREKQSASICVNLRLKVSPPPNEKDDRPRASGVEHETEASSRGSAHPDCSARTLAGHRGLLSPRRMPTTSALQRGQSPLVISALFRTASLAKYRDLPQLGHKNPVFSAYNLSFRNNR